MKEKFTIFLYNILRSIINFLPEKIAYLPGKLIAYLAYLITPERRKIAAANLKRALDVSEAEAKKMIKEVYLNLGYNFAEFLMEDKLSAEDIDQMVDFEGLKYLDQALKKGKGVIIYSAHLGNWELLGAVLAIKGYRIHSIAQEQDNSLFDQKINQIRKRTGIGIIPKGFSIRKAFKILKKNEILAILGDQHARNNGWELSFFERPALTFAGVVQFARRTGAPVVPMFFHRQGWLKHKLKCYPAREISADTVKSELKSELQSLVELTEKEIRKDPADWMWLHKRWKNSN